MNLGSLIKKIGRFFYNPESAKAYKEWNKSNNDNSFFSWLAGKQIDMTGSPLGSLLNKETGAGLTGAERATMEYNSAEADKARQFNAEEAQKQRDWEEQMDATKWQRQVTGLEAAGLNPALAYGHSIPTPSGAAASGPSASVGLSSNGSGLLSMIMQLKSMDIQERLANADIREKNANAEGKEIENSYLTTLKDAEVEGAKLANDLTNQQIDNLKEAKKEIGARIDKLIKETDNEVAKKLLIEAQTNWQNLQVEQAVKLFPLQQELIKAQTDAQRGAAAASFARAAIDQGLLNEGYVAKTIDKLSNDALQALHGAERADAERKIAEFRASFKTGTFQVPEDASKVDKALVKYLFNPLANALSYVGEGLIGPLAGILK